MLSIKLRNDEWWVSAKHFERLFNAAIAAGDIPPTFEEWLHVALANGGLDCSLLDKQVAQRLQAGLRAAAKRKIATHQDLTQTAENSDYLRALHTLL